MPARMVVKGEIRACWRFSIGSHLPPRMNGKTILQTVATQAANAIVTRDVPSMQKLNTDMLLAYDETIEGWAAALELRDP